MGHSEFDPAAQERRPWNAGRMVGAKRALKPQQVWAIRFWLDSEKRLRDRALFDLAIDSKLRGCDIVKMWIGDLVSGGRVRTRAAVTQQKTGRPVQFELLEAARASIQAWLEHRRGALEDYAFPSRTDHARYISARQYARLVDEWVTAIGLCREDYGTHLLRRTKASIIYKATGNLRAVQLLLGHTKIESTVRYLGVDVEDALNLAEHTEVRGSGRLLQPAEAGNRPIPAFSDPDAPPKSSRPAHVEPMRRTSEQRRSIASSRPVTRRRKPPKANPAHSDGCARLPSGLPLAVETAVISAP